MKPYGIIYTVRNKVNNKLYIGQTIFTFKTRYKNDLYKNTKNEYLRRAIKKYEINNFVIDENFDVAYSKEELDKLECMYINMYKTTDRKYGYNIMGGGHNGKHSIETRNKIRIAQLGELNHMYGKCGKDNPKYTRVDAKCYGCGIEIQVLKCNIKRNVHHYCSKKCHYKMHGESLKGRRDSKVSVKCECCGIEYKRFPSQIKDREFLYCSRECQYKHYTERANGSDNPNYNNGDKIKGSKNGRAKRVLCITTKEVFETARSAEEKYDIHRGGVGACCRGNQKLSGGFEWKYEN